MNLIRCDQGHFYDADQNEQCPHCRQSAKYSNETVSFSASDKYQKTDAMQDFEKTMSFFQENVGLEPVVGWLVCTAGAQYGKDYRLKSGRNFIGRSKDMDVSLDGEKSVSREKHAAIIYEPKQNIFLAQPGDSKSLFYLNGNVVLTPVEIKKNDRIQVGNAELMLIPCCDTAFEWGIKEAEKSENK